MTTIDGILNELDEKFTPKKMQNNDLYMSYKRLGWLKKADRLLDCGSDLEFRMPADGTGEAKLHFANFCKDRLCVMCSWRRSMKIFGQVSKIMDIIQNQYAFIFITLTVQNCSGENLKETINTLNTGFNLLSKTAQWKHAIKGCFKALEITHHPEYLRNIEYHPHFHLICAVNKSYFTSRDYISHSEMVSLWQKACKLDYAPSVDVRTVKTEKTNKEEISIKKAVCEVAKYTIKSSDILKGDFEEIDRTVKAFINGITGRRLCSFTGIFKETAKQLKLDDLNDGDLINTDNEEVRQDVAYIIVKYRWQIGYGYLQEYIQEVQYGE